MSTLVHITPQLPPAIDGVGDYCWNLWQHWPEPQPDWEFLVARGADETQGKFPQLKAREFALNAASLAKALEQAQSDTVVLHYVGYAYQPKGIPVWLPRALAQWRNASRIRCPASRRLVVMFHEMYARSSPLRSPFWVAPIARQIIRQLVALSDAWVTSCDRYFNQLTTEFGAVPEAGRMVPIASNVPPPANLHWNGSLAPRRRVLVFGLAKTRLWALERHWRALRALQRAGLIEHITLMGKGPEAHDERTWQRFAKRIGDGVKWRKRFDLTTAEISRELARHDVGLLANAPDVLTKSGVFAAFATHGVVPMISVSGDAPVTPALRGALLVNDERSTVARIVQLLRDGANWRERREKLLKVAGNELAWPGIAQAWSGVLQKAEARQRTASAVEANARRGLQTQATLEVSA